jgi:hypothetical protein
MTTSLHLPRSDDDDADFGEMLPFDLSRFLDALERTPLLEHGFGLHDVRKVEFAWEFLDVDFPAHGYVVDLVDGRRVALEVQQDDGSDIVTIEPLSTGAMPSRRSEDERTAPWYEAHHITLHIAELKLLPHDD